MKALTIHQPYAWLILAGHKTVENRTWATKYRGRIAVHAGSRNGAESLGYLDAARSWREKGYEVPDVEDLQFGAILGTVDLVDCVPISRVPLTDPFAFGPWCWILAEPLCLPKPIPCRGQPGLWESEKIPGARIVFRRRN